VVKVQKGLQSYSFEMDRKHLYHSPVSLALAYLKLLAKGFMHNVIQDANINWLSYKYDEILSFYIYKINLSDKSINGQ